jgi:hypothetical protein
MATDPAIIDPPAEDPPVVDATVAPDQTDQTVQTDDKKPAKEPAKQPDATDWRSEMAGEDADLLKYLGRYHSKDAALKAFRTTQGEIRSGKYIKPLGDDPSEDDVAAYRKTFGVPEKPEGYLETLPDGLVVGEDDKPYVDKFVEAMHAVNAPKADVDAALATYYNIVEEQADAERQEAEQAKHFGEDALRQEWGADYRRNLNVMHSHLETLPAPVRAAMQFGTMPVLDDEGQPTGKSVPIGYHPDVLMWLTSLALDKNPLATVVPGAGANQASAIADEIATIEETMRTNRKKYNDSPEMQARLRTLYDAREKIK